MIVLLLCAGAFPSSEIALVDFGALTEVLGRMSPLDKALVACLVPPDSAIVLRGENAA